MTTITPELRQAIDQAGDEPARIIDPETGLTYLLVREHDFVVLPIDWDGELSLAEQDGLLREMGHSVGWGDAEMKVYDREARKA